MKSDEMFNPGRDMRIDRITSLGPGPSHKVGTLLVISITRALEPGWGGHYLVYVVHYEDGGIMVCTAWQFEAHYVRSAPKSYED